MLKEDVGISAWTIWVLLSRNGKLSIQEICEMTDCSDSFVFLTLGWLFRENIVCFFIENNTLYTELSGTFSETYS